MSSYISITYKPHKPNVFKMNWGKFLKITRKKFSSHVPNSNKYGELVKLPRYTKTEAELLGENIKVPDSASFLAMYKEIFINEIYKFEVKKANPLIIDGGANIGLATIYFKTLYPGAKILAFEPDPDIFKIMKNNIEAFGFKNIVLEQKGLWNENTKLTFNHEGADSGSFNNNSHNFNSTKKIGVISLKSILKSRIDLLKLDIEGAETIVLQDIKDDLKFVDRIFVEYHSFVNEKQSLNQIIDILSKAGFRLFISAPGNSVKSPFCGLKIYNDMDLQLNIFGIKEYI